MHVSHGFTLTTSYPATVATALSSPVSPMHVSRGFRCTTSSSSHGVGIGAGVGDPECTVGSPEHTWPDGSTKSVSIARCGSGESGSDGGVGAACAVSPMHIAPGVRLSMMKYSGRVDVRCADDDEGPAPADACPLTAPLAAGFEEDGSRVPLDEGPHAQHSCVRRAGLGNVLYVEPKDVYLSAKMRK